MVKKVRPKNKTSPEEMKEHMAKFTNGDRPLNLVTGHIHHTGYHTRSSKKHPGKTIRLRSRNINGYRNLQC